MEDELVSIDRILCDCYEDDKPKTWGDHAKVTLQIAALSLAITLIAGLSCVGLLDIVLGTLVSLP